MKKLYVPEEQIKILAENTYTRRVSEFSITFTPEFKRKFIELRNKGLPNRKIFEACGYDPAMMGIQIMAGVARQTKGKSAKDFPDKRPLAPKTPTFNEKSDKIAMKQMQHEILYMRQEIEFLKKSWQRALLFPKMISFDKPSVRFELIQETLAEESNIITVSDLCKIAGVSRPGYYRWISNEANRIERERRDREDFELILEAYKFRKRAKGARGIHMRMLHLEEPVIMNVKKIRRLMKKYQLICPVRKANPYRQMMRAIKTSNVADNIVNRKFTECGPRTVLLTDITYIPFEEGFCYLSTVIDAVTRQILSYELSKSLEEEFALKTITKLMNVVLYLPCKSL